MLKMYEFIIRNIILNVFLIQILPSIRWGNYSGLKRILKYFKSKITKDNLNDYATSNIEIKLVK